MTLGENKKIMLGLIEEFSPTNVNLTDDEDIYSRLNLVYSPNYQFLSQKKPIIKTEEIAIEDNEDGTKIIEYPKNLRQLKRIIVLDPKNNRITAEYEEIGKKIYVKNKEGKLIIEYYAYPEQISLKTEDKHELEIDIDAQALLPYLVANDILKVDPSADYTAFYAEYQRRREEFDSRITLPSAVIVGGI